MEETMEETMEITKETQSKEKLIKWIKEDEESLRFHEKKAERFRSALKAWKFGIEQIDKDNKD